MKNKIFVTKTFLPPKEDYELNIETVWKSGFLTNNGPLVQKLSAKIKNKLKVNKLILMNNGTLPINIALNAWAKNGEVITTPFSYVATTASIVWEKCTPVFVDIEPEYLTIDPKKIEKCITDKTTAILATHVFGNPVNIEEIQAIGDKYGLKIIYDAAHCFGVKYKEKSIFNYGDASTCSFHATKLFHSGEGGAIFCSDEESYHEFYYRHNFGHNGPLEFHGLGINAKMSELHAAMGLSVLPHIDDLIALRKKICDRYDEGLNLDRIKTFKLRPFTEWNYSYYPIIFNSEEQLLLVEKKLTEEGIYPRRYFYPSLEKLPYINSNQCPIAENISCTILCLPLYHDLDINSQEKIISLINGII